MGRYRSLSNKDWACLSYCYKGCGVILPFKFAGPRISAVFDVDSLKAS